MSFDPSKCDPDLGLRVQEHLVKLGLHTPINNEKISVPAKDKIEIIERHTREVWKALGLDLNDDSLSDTPRRIAKMLVLETTWGLDPYSFPKCTAIENKMGYDEMLIERGVKVMSLCEHHGVVIDGKATVAYIPKGKVIGLSKINRVVDYFSRRPQVQERLTAQIMEALKLILETDDVAVSITARHYCVISRGIEDTGSETVSTALSGQFKTNPGTRHEFMAALKG